MTDHRGSGLGERWRRALHGGLAGASRQLDRASRVIGLMAGATARQDDLARVAEEHWGYWGDSEQHRHAGLSDWERTLYLRWLGPSDRVLLVGCGTGRDLLALRQIGHDVEGLDAAPRAAARAAELLDRHALPTTVHTGAIERWALPRRYDAIVFSCLSYALVPGTAARRAMLARLRPHMEAGGRIVLSVEESRPPRRAVGHLVRLVGRLAGSDWRPEPGDVVRAATGPERYERFEHRFAPGEVAEEAHAAGLAVAFERALGWGIVGLVLVDGTEGTVAAAGEG